MQCVNEKEIKAIFRSVEQRNKIGNRNFRKKKRQRLPGEIRKSSIPLWVDLEVAF